MVCSVAARLITPEPPMKRIFMRKSRLPLFSGRPRADRDAAQFGDGFEDGALTALGRPAGEDGFQIIDDESADERLNLGRAPEAVGLQQRVGRGAAGFV